MSHQPRDLSPQKDLAALRTQTARAEVRLPKIFSAPSLFPEDGESVEPAVIQEPVTLKEARTDRELQELFFHLEVRDDEPFVCTCLSDYYVEFFDQQGEALATLTVHHGAHVRRRDEPRWYADLVRDGFERWLGVKQDDFEANVAREAQHSAGKVQEKELEWIRLAPRCLRDNPPEHLEEQLALLSRELGSQRSVVLSLLRWYGNGSGSWMRYPSWEKAPADLLDRLPLETVVEIVEECVAKLQEEELEGAARYLSAKPGKAIPKGVKKALLSHCESSPSADGANLESARAAFGGALTRLKQRFARKPEPESSEINLLDL